MMLVTVHVSVVVADTMLAVGGVIFLVIDTCLVEVQPLVPVTVTRYVPLFVTVMDVVDTPVLHA